MVGTEAEHDDLEQYAVRTIRWLRHPHPTHSGIAYWPRHASLCHYLWLPIVTRSLATHAKTLGGFGLVAQEVTNPYHTAHTRPLVILVRSGPLLPLLTKHYQVADLTISAGLWPLPTSASGIREWVIDCYNGLGHMIDCGEYPTWLVVEAVFDAVGLGLAICFELDMGRRVILVMYWIWLILD